ncbi:DUF11 domain-containing protein [Gimesia aquarii]|uniref:Large cysteine-rich periplasmic protein omcB n=1 Tax=Gimesia aquarii TaxID=2527964 RepID=A0A517VTI2_9PLAN|nr:DUF11 domain-containing protein [Gimesia aquarii]QDT96324.1 Large cysteine-rich periplasmic protein omcB precursor [Gimesia aquarii]
MPESDDQNSSWNRHEPLAPESETDEGWPTDLEGTLSEEGIEPESGLNASNAELEEFDFSLKFEDYAPVWLQKLRSFFSSDPEWSFASAVGCVAIILTVILLLAMPEDKVKQVADHITAPEAEIAKLPDSEPIDSRIDVEVPSPYAWVEVGSEPLYVSFGEFQKPISEVVVLEERAETPFKLPEFNKNPETAKAPAIVMDVQKIRIIEREILDPAIDESFVLKSQPSPVEMESRLDPAELLLFDQNWKLFDLVRAETRTQQTIRPTLYRERFPGGEHLQVGQEQPLDRSQLDRLTRVTAPQQSDQLNIEIRKRIPQNGTVQNLLTYSLLVKNQGTSPAYNVQIDEELSPATSLVDVSPSAEVKQNHLYWNIARLDPDEERELKIKVFLDQEGNAKTNSIIRLASKVTASTDISAPRLAVQMTGPDVVTEGEIFPLDFIVSNQGRHDQREVALNLDLPEGLEHAEGQRLTLKIDQLAARESRTLRARVKATKSGLVTSQATLAAQGISHEQTSLKQKIVERKTESQPMNSQQTPAQSKTPLKSTAPPQFCPCQPVYLPPVIYLVP